MRYECAQDIEKTPQAATSSLDHRRSPTAESAPCDQPQRDRAKILRRNQSRWRFCTARPRQRAYGKRQIISPWQRKTSGREFVSSWEIEKRWQRVSLLDISRRH